jgi:hypothetical protein
MPILKKSKRTVRRPELISRGPRGCSFPTTETETRTFTDGEPVCGRSMSGAIEPYLFTKIEPPHPWDKGTMYALRTMDGIARVSLLWKDVGKIKKMSDTMISSIARQKNLPEDIERLIKKYGGKRRKTRRRRSTRRS